MNPGNPKDIKPRTPRAIPKAAYDMVREFEGLRLVAYPDPGTRGAPYTVGYGHTAGVFKDTHIGVDMAVKLLKLDLEEAGRYVEKLVTVELNNNEFSALISFVFNLGYRNLQNSTLLRKLNEGDRLGAAEEFLKWNKAAKRVMQGLTRRRESERSLFLTPIPPAQV